MSDKIMVHCAKLKRGEWLIQRSDPLQARPVGDRLELVYHNPAYIKATTRKEALRIYTEEHLGYALLSHKVVGKHKHEFTRI